MPTISAEPGKPAKPPRLSISSIPPPESWSLRSDLPDQPTPMPPLLRLVAAYPAWRRTPPQNRIQYLFRFRELLLAHADDIARLTTQENGKTFAEAYAELQRGIENVEVACGIPP